MSGSIGESPVEAYVLYSGNEAKYANANVTANAAATGLINYFTAHAASITTPQALLGNYKALSVVLGAFGLGSQISETAVLKQLLTQDPNSKTSLAYKTGNAKYIEFATALQHWSPPPFSTKAGIQSIITAYKNNVFDTYAGTQTPGLGQALYFQRSAASIKSLTQLQSDPELLAVAVTGVGLPLTDFENLSFTQQTALLTAKLNIKDLQTPSYVNHLAELYLVQQQLNAGSVTQTAALGSVAGLFSPTTTSSASDGLLGILQSSQNPSEASSISLLGTTTTANNPILSLFA